MADPYREDNGTWTFVFDAPRRGDGRRRQIKRRGFRTKREARVELERLRAQYSRGYTGQSVTVAEAAEEFVEILQVEGRLQEATIDGYEAQLRLHIVPALGTLRLEDVTARDLRRFYRDQQEKGMSARSIELAHTTLSKLYRYAADQMEVLPDGWRPPTKKVDPPHPASRSSEKTAWTEDEVVRFLAAVADEPDYAMWVTAVHTGMRVGELVALNFGDVDLEHGLLAIRRAQKKNMTLGPVKNYQEREIALTPVNAHVLAGWMNEVERTADEWGWQVDGSTPLFCRPDGSRLRKDTVGKRFKTLVPDGVRPVGLHELRHTHGTLLLRAGVPVDEIAERLGHRPDELLRTYAHIVGAQKRRAADQFAGLLPAASNS